MGQPCLYLLLIIWIIGLPWTDGRVEQNINQWLQRCCTNCPDVRVLVGQDVINMSRYAWICQMGKDGDLPYYATLFDKDRKIPIFSKFVVQIGNCKRADCFILEGDLVAPMDGHLKTYQEITNKLHDWGWDNIHNRIKSSQALDGDYDAQRSPKQYEKGHLNPHSSFCYVPDAVQSTFTYTNVAPQQASFNKGTWRIVEATMRLYAGSCNNHVAVVGVTPSNGEQLNSRVNIPSFFWTYLWCDGTIAAILAPNIENNVIKNDRLITHLYLKVEKLHNLLDALHNLFYSSRNEFVNNINNFRQEMKDHASPVPQGDIFFEKLDCEPYLNNVNRCVGNRSKSVMNK